MGLVKIANDSGVKVFVNSKFAEKRDPTVISSWYGARSRDENRDGGRIWLTAVRHGFAFVSRVLSMLDREPILVSTQETARGRDSNVNDVQLRRNEQPPALPSRPCRCRDKSPCDRRANR